jgi:uncharacterized protein (TIGR02996 family)
MTDRESMLAAVVADPDNPLPRLVFADFLDETGDPDWAELIRLQNGYFKHWTNAEEMQEHEAELVEAVMARYPEVRGVKLGLPIRGFPEELIFNDPRIESTEELESLFAHYPIIQFDFRPALPRWAGRTGMLRRAVVIDLSTSHFASRLDCDDFFHELDPTRLRCLRWQSASVSDEDVLDICIEASTLAGLSELNLGNNNVSPIGCDGLIRSPYLTQLEYLDLRGNPVGDAAEQLERRFGRALRLV